MSFRGGGVPENKAPVSFWECFCGLKHKFGSNRQAAFTMAEVLITLGIIGIVVAMTLPTIITKYQKKQTVTQLKKVYTVLSQQILRAQLDNGDYDTWPTGANIVVKDYFNMYYKPYFNGVNICMRAVDCGYKTDYCPWVSLTGSSLYWNLRSDTSRIMFQLNDGTTIFLPRNTTDAQGNPSFVNFMFVDINGAKNPNVVGKDVFVFTVDKTKGLVPYCYNRTQSSINASCRKGYSGSVNCCAAKIMADGWKIKDDYPW